MSVLIRNGWEIYFHQRLFGEQRQKLRERVKKLKAELPESDYLTHPDVKLLAAVMAGIKEKIVVDPISSQFALTGSLHWFITAIWSNEKNGITQSLPTIFSSFC